MSATSFTCKIGMYMVKAVSKGLTYCLFFSYAFHMDLKLTCEISVNVL